MFSVLCWPWYDFDAYGVPFGAAAATIDWRSAFRALFCVSDICLRKLSR
jgi:hypothetical protein